MSLTGLGAMGLGVAYQIGRTPGMRSSFVADYDETAAKKGADVYGKPTNIRTDSIAALNDPTFPAMSLWKQPTPSSPRTTTAWQRSSAMFIVY
jgi:hypothetical protein